MFFGLYETLEEKVELLSQVKKAITNILLGAQEYKIGKKVVTRANLTELRLFRKELIDEINEMQTDDGPFGKVNVSYFDRR